MLIFGTRTIRKLAIAALMIGLATGAGCMRVPCDLVVLDQSSSPSSRYAATTFTVDCGAVGDIFTILNVRLSVDELTRSSERLLQVDGDFRSTFAWEGGKKL